MTALKFILVKPRNPDNIGACARAMANFGLAELALVSPFESDWAEAVKNWRQEASVSAIDSMEIIDSARIYPGISEAMEGCDILLGTSSLHRIRPDRDVIALKDAAAYLERRGAVKAGLLFGPERTGLTRDELSLCNAIVNIPTKEKQPSMNLGQAVAVAAYELSARRHGVPAAVRAAPAEASPHEIDRLTAGICTKLGKRGRAGGDSLAAAIRRGLLDARLTKNAAHALKQLLKD